MRNLTFQTDYQIELLAWCTNLSRLQMIWDYYVLQRQWIYWRNWMYLVLSLCDAWDGCIYPLFAGSNQFHRFEKIEVYRKRKLIRNKENTQKLTVFLKYFFEKILDLTFGTRSKIQGLWDHLGPWTLDWTLAPPVSQEPRDDLRDQPLAVKKLFNREVTVSQGFAEV